MTTLHGTGISPGMASGPLHFLTRENAPVPKTAGLNPQTELARFQTAQTETISRLLALSAECRDRSDAEAALLFETHALLAEDEDFSARVHELIERETCSAEYAVQAAREEYAALFSSMDDDYMQARAADVRDVSGRLIDSLTGRSAALLSADTPVILAADDLAPSETARLDRSLILAFLTREGSPTGHTAILARTMGIPAVCGLGGALTDRCAGQQALVDGQTGEVILNPDESARALHREKAQKQQEETRQLLLLKDAEDTAPDGRKIDLTCNIASPDDLPAVQDCGARGIGLFRSEFLYLSSGDYPTEEQQFAAYRQAASAMNGRRVVIRTLDVGADKQADYFRLKKEENPALGMRAVRICLTRPDLFRTQLRAIYRASAFGNVAILFPMIASVWEIRACRQICREVMDELKREGVPFNPAAETGVMIETPASLLIADELAQEADFFSVGTNDLTQYLLACDRQMSEPGRFYDPKHPAVLRALKMAAGAAHDHGIWIGVCGDLAADPDLLPLFLSLNIDELSVPPSSVLPLRRELRQMNPQKELTQHELS